MSGDELPQGWRRARLGEISTIVGGSTPSSTVSAYWNGDVDWVTPTDLGELKGEMIQCSARRISHAGLEACSTVMLPIGTVVMSSRAPIGHLGIAAVPLCTNQGCKSFVPGTDVISRYLYWALKREMPAIQALGAGNTFAEVSKSKLQEVNIPLPPVPEQRRIAEVIDAAVVEAAAAAHSAEVQTRAVVEVGRSYTNKLIGELVDAHGCVRLEKLAPARDAFRDGPFGSNLKTAHYSSAGARVVRLQNVGDNEFFEVHRAYVPLTHFETIRAHEVIAGDVIVAALGDGARPAGRACVMPKLDTPAVVKADCFRIRPPSTLHPKFLAIGINSSFVRAQLTSQLRGATRPRVNLEMLRSVLFPAVPVDLQSRLVDQLEEMNKEICLVRSKLISQELAIAALPASVLSAAFQGRF